MMPCGILLPSRSRFKKGIKPVTIHNPKTVIQALKSKGMLEDMMFERIYKYESMDGGVQFALFQNAQWDDMAGNQYVKNPVLLIDGGKVTAEGKEFLKSQGV